MLVVISWNSSLKVFNNFIWEQIWQSLNHLSYCQRQNNWLDPRPDMVQHASFVIKFLDGSLYIIGGVWAPCQTKTCYCQPISTADVNTKDPLQRAGNFRGGKRYHSLYSSVQSVSRIRLSANPWTAAHQASLSITNPRVYSNSHPLSWWFHPTISSSVILFSSHLQSCLAPGSFQMSQFFTSGGQSIGVSASTSYLPMNIQDWFPLGWTRWISLQFKGLSRVFSNTTVQKHQFFGSQLSL